MAAGLKISKIADLLGRHKSAISREIRKGRGAAISTLTGQEKHINGQNGTQVKESAISASYIRKNCLQG
ncbi:MAG: helix-turn-helix domain-containing protein [Candidatus Goldbacteria bacterium]|nr:helix-turn-helix domain-containing protein [Candidatus Goldiibacteriota bacterium]